MSIDGWIKKMCGVLYTVEYYSAIKTNEILTFVITRMGLESILLSEISQSEKGKYHMISLTCGISGTKQVNEAKGRKSKKQTLTSREQADGYQSGGGWEDGGSR